MLSRRHLLLSAAAGLAGCASAGPRDIASPPRESSAPPPAPPSPDVQLSALFDEMFANALRESPELVTSLGLDARHPGAKARLGGSSLADKARRQALTREELDKLRAIDRSRLSGMSAINYDAVLYGRERKAEADRAFAWGGEGAGAPYVLSQITGAYQEIPDFLATQHTVETREDAEAYVARLGELARVMDEECERVRHDVAAGVVPPDFAIRGALGQMKTWSADPAQSTLVTSLVERARDKGIAGDWAGRAGAAYTGQVLPALQRQMALLNEILPRATHDAGVWKLPDGEAYYALALRSQTTSNLSPQEVHQLGLDITRQLHARADVLFRKLGMTKGSVGGRYTALFKSGKGVYPNTDAGKAREIADLNKVVQDMEKRLPQYFGTLPKADLLINRVPPATEAGASTHYTEGSLDGSRPGIYWLNLRDTGEAPMWDMYTTTYHEGVPGHHLQISLSREADLPMIRKIAGYGAYIEGWALYAEQLAQEMGVYEGNPLGELGYVHDALLRSGRLVTDTGIHALRWSREQAIAALIDADGDPPALAAQEIERYAVWPGQACSYMVGKLTWLRLREKAQAALGPRFDIRQFHDAGLLSGAMPLTVLDSVIDRYIAGAESVRS